MKKDLTIGLLRVAAKLPAFVMEVGRHVVENLSDGKIDPDEAEKLAREASLGAGDILRVKVRGEDVIDDDAQADLAAFVGRVTSKTVHALRS